MRDIFIGIAAFMLGIVFSGFVWQSPDPIAVVENGDCLVYHFKEIYDTTYVCECK